MKRRRSHSGDAGRWNKEAAAWGDERACRCGSTLEDERAAAQIVDKNSIVIFSDNSDSTWAKVVRPAGTNEWADCWAMTNRLNEKKKKNARNFE